MQMQCILKKLYMRCIISAITLSLRRPICNAFSANVSAMHLMQILYPQYYFTRKRRSATHSTLNVSSIHFMHMYLQYTVASVGLCSMKANPFLFCGWSNNLDWTSNRSKAPPKRCLFSRPPSILYIA